MRRSFQAMSCAALLLGTTLVASSKAAPTPTLDQEFDIAMDGTTFFFEGPLTPTGVPAEGTPFVISGYIYPGDTFERHGELSGVLPDGSPQFPDQVLGTWICRGWHLQDADAATGAVVATTQIFDFQDGVEGTHTIITDGIELADFDLPFSRAITGATGRLESLDSEWTQCSQVYVGDGVNITGGFNTEFTFTR